jgi:hypothetical protein
LDVKTKAMRTHVFFTENWKWLVFLSLISLFTALVRFGWVYPDSENYLLLVRFFRGEIPFSEITEPFSYRPLLPIIASLIPLQPELVFATVNTVLIILLSWIFFALSRDFGFSRIASFLASALCSFSWVVAYYGAAVLVDAGAVFCLSFALLMIYRNEGDITVALILTLGVLFKEIALVGVIASILWLRKLKPFTLILPLSTHLLVRFLFSVGDAGYLWYFHLDNLGVYLESTVKTLGLTLGPFLVVLLCAIIFRNANAVQFSNSLKWLVLVGLPCLAILFMGLFMARFDSRFVWPVYPALVRVTAYGLSQIVDRVNLYYSRNTDTSFQTSTAAT